LSKLLKYVFLLLILSTVWSQTTIQIGAGGLTPHVTESKKNYCNQWNDTGIIFNRTYYARIGSGNHSLTLMAGEDSICSPIEGLFYTYRFYPKQFFEVGFIVGGYSFDQENWDEREANRPAGFKPVELVTVEVLGLEFVPIIGLEVGVHMIRGQGWSLKLNNIFTPIITNHSLALEWRF
jgi:hypothetical protein